MSADTVSLQVKDHQSIFFSSAIHARESSHLTDVVITTGSKQFLAHKLILSSFSGYFYRLFNKSSMDDHNYAVNIKVDVVHLEDIDPTDMELLLHYMYYGEVNVQKSHVMDFLKIAQHFQIKGLCNDQLQNSIDELINKTNESKTQQPNILKRKSSTSLNYPINKLSNKQTRFVDGFPQVKKCFNHNKQSSPKETKRSRKVKAALIELKREKEEKIKRFNALKEYKKLEKAEERLSAKCFDIQIEKNAVDMENKVFKEFIELEETKIHIRLQLKEREAYVVNSSGNTSTLRSELSQKTESEINMEVKTKEDPVRVECAPNPQLMFENLSQKSRLTETLRKLERRSLRLARRNPMLGPHSLLSRKYNSILGIDVEQL